MGNGMTTERDGVKTIVVDLREIERLELTLEALLGSISEHVVSDEYQRGLVGHAKSILATIRDESTDLAIRVAPVSKELFGA